VDRAGAEEWIRAHVDPVGPIEAVRERSWATVLRVPLADGVAWFKACAPVQVFEPRLTAELFARWPDQVAEVLGHAQQRAWLLLADAGTPIRTFGNPPEAWLAALPLHAELQRGETVHTPDHLAHGVPDLCVVRLPARYEDLLRHELPLESSELGRLRRFATRFAELCGDLAAQNVPETLQHGDLHMGNVYSDGQHLRLLDWGTRRSRTPSPPSSSRSGSSRSSTTCRRPIRGSRGCATRIWSRGERPHRRVRACDPRRLVRARLPWRASVTRCRRSNAPNSIRTSGSCCGAQSLRCFPSIKQA
jgi:hypothetical protein